MKKTRILYLMGWFAAGGIEAYVKNVIDHIDKEAYAIDFAICKAGTFGLEQQMIGKDHRIIYLNGGSVLQQRREMRQLLQQEKYDIVHVMQGFLAIEAHTFYTLACLSYRKKFGYKVICHSHSVDDLTKSVNPIKRMLRSLLRGMLRAQFNRADAFAACSPIAGEFMYGSHANVHFLRNGINLQRFADAAQSPFVPQWREQYQIPENRINIAAVSRVSDEKNPIFLTDVMAELVTLQPNILLSWAGSGPMLEQVTQRIEEKGLQNHIHMLGNQSHVEQILACCDYFIFPSKREGAGIAIVEAQAENLTCFASSAVPSIIDCGGVTFLDLQAPAAHWAKAISQSIEASTAVSIDSAQLHQFDIQVTVAQLCELYDSLST